MLSMLNPSHSRSARVAIKYCRLLLRYKIVWEKINKQLCYSDTKQKAAHVTSIKEKVEFWGKVNNNLWAFVIILIMQVWKNIKEKSYSLKIYFKGLHIPDMTSNSFKMRPDLYAICLCSPISISFCVQCLLLYQDWAKVFIILMTPKPCTTHQYLHVYARWSTFSDCFHTVSFMTTLNGYIIIQIWRTQYWQKGNKKEGCTLGYIQRNS